MTPEQAIEIIKLLHNLNVMGYIIIGLLGCILGMVFGK